MLARHVDVNATQVDGMTALHWAAHHDDLDTVEALLRAGADASASESLRGHAAVDCLHQRQRGDGEPAFWTRAPRPSASLPGGETALMTAARTGSLPTVSLLLSRGAPVDAKDERRGQTALMWAAAEGHAPVVAGIASPPGPTSYARLPSGFTPLLFAVREGRLDVVRALVKRGRGRQRRRSPPDGPGPRRRGYGGSVPPAGTTPLLLAVTNAHFELAAALLDAGANPNADAARLHGAPR